METSLRYSGDSKSLRIYAKEKYPFHSSTLLQLHGELDTRLGAPTQFGAMIRHFYSGSLNSDLSASLGVGLLYNKKEKIRYHVRGKMKYAVTSDDKLNFHVKGRCETDPEFRQKKYGGAAEFSWFIPNFKNDQDVRLKVGYEISDKVPYMQIRENNWTLNANVNGRWNLRYDL